MFTTYIQNGVAVGKDAAVLNDARIGSVFIPGMMQPWRDAKGRPCVTLPTNNQKTGKDGEPLWDQFGNPVVEYRDFRCDALRRQGFDHPTWNASFLRKNEWYRVQEKVIQANRTRLRAWNDIAARNPVTGFDGMGTYQIEYEMENDPGEAIRHMEIIPDLRHDETQYKVQAIPLPVTQSGFHYTQRRLAMAQQNGRSLPGRSASNAGRRVAESMERVTVGTATGVTWGTRSTGVQPHEGSSTEYGLTNAPWRYTKTDLNTPTGTNPEAVMADLIEMRETLIAAGWYGPFGVYYSTGYDRYFSDDYFRTGGTSVTRIVRERLLAIEDIEFLRRLDVLTSGYQLIMFDLTDNTMEAVIGMNLTTVQWSELGGALQKFRVMFIGAPLVHRNSNGNTGIVHGTTS